MQNKDEIIQQLKQEISSFSSLYQSHKAEAEQLREENERLQSLCNSQQIVTDDLVSENDSLTKELEALKAKHENSVLRFYEWMETSPKAWDMVHAKGESIEACYQYYKQTHEA